MMRLPVAGAVALLWLGGCASPSDPAAAPAAAQAASPAATASAPAIGQAPGGWRYRCDQGISFTVNFKDGSAVLDAGPRGSDVLLQDAGGATPQQTVYSNTRMRAEFGLGVSGREAMLRYASPPLAAHCVQD